MAEILTSIAPWWQQVPWYVYGIGAVLVVYAAWKPAAAVLTTVKKWLAGAKVPQKADPEMLKKLDEIIALLTKGPK